MFNPDTSPDTQNFAVNNPFEQTADIFHQATLKHVAVVTFSCNFMVTANDTVIHIIPPEILQIWYDFFNIARTENGNQQFSAVFWRNKNFFSIFLPNS